jgi:type III pantothenate kinase
VTGPKGGVDAGTLLALDAGNTRVGVGVFRGEALVVNEAVAHRGHPDLAGAVADLAVRATGPGPWAGAVLASVAPSLDGALTEACRRVTGADPLVIDHTSDLGLTLGVRNPAGAGADRLVNGAAAFLLFGGPLVVVDAGTAVTTTAVTADGRYLGGAIAPGPGIALEALTARTERLPAVALEAPEGPIGDDTPAALRAGAVLGFAGLVDRLARDAARALAPDGGARIYLTGGHAPLLAPYLTVPHQRVPDLTLKGLRLLFARARG